MADKTQLSVKHRDLLRNEFEKNRGHIWTDGYEFREPLSYRYSMAGGALVVERAPNFLDQVANAAGTMIN